MLDLKQSLLACGYEGPCENLTTLKWALRAGASSDFFNDLIRWLELQLTFAVSTQQAHDNIVCLFTMLRQSILMKASYGSDSATNPMEFRLQTLKVLIRQLQLRKLPECMKHVGERNVKNDLLDKIHLKNLTITFNRDEKSNLGVWNQRSVSYNKNADTS